MLSYKNDNQDLIGNIGRKISTLRRKRKVSQEELASKLGISSKQLSKYEIGRNRITVDRLISIAQILNMNIIDFFEINNASSISKKERGSLNNFSRFRKLSGEDLLLKISELVED